MSEASDPAGFSGLELATLYRAGILDARHADAAVLRATPTGRRHR